ncbi:MAG: polymer-forming cytoskeletal protein [Methanomicrobiaceae archaeon]|nr:polymer-forming cytoskeletal protein [Methanomicrobiaceae archaeon]
MKVYRRGDTYIAPRGAYFDGNVKIDGNFIAPAETHIWGRLEVFGSLELGPYSTVGDAVFCTSAVIGKGARIKGSVEALESVTICDGVRVRSIRAGGDVILRPDVKVGDVHSDETIFVYGKIKSGQLNGRNLKIFGY